MIESYPITTNILTKF